MRRQMTEQRRLICRARENLHTAINHTGDYDDDEISELIEEAIYDIVAAALQLDYMTHEIKLLEQYAQAVKDGEKTFEIRYNDRSYQKGDRIKFTVVDENGCKAYHELDDEEYEITYVHSGFGMADNYVALAIRPVGGNKE